MKQSRHHLAEIIGEKTMHITDARELSKEVAAYLLHEKETADFESLMRDIMQYRSDNGIIETVAVSTSELPEHVIRDIQKMLENEFPKAKRIIVSQRQSDDVVGGLRLDFANEQLDMTVKAKLSKFKQLTALERMNG